MAEIVLEQNLAGFSEDNEALSEAIVKMQKNLSWLLSHLDSRNVTALNTSLTKIESEDGATTLDGAQIRMLDASGRLRAVFGKSREGDFVFEIYDARGGEAIHLDEDGNAVFSGHIEGASISGAKISGAEIEGTNVRIAPNVFKDYIALENDGREDTLSLYYSGTRIGGIRMLDAGGMEIFGHRIVIGSQSGSVSIGCGASGTFVADNKTITVEDGIITSIV